MSRKKEVLESILLLVGMVFTVGGGGGLGAYATYKAIEATGFLKEYAYQPGFGPHAGEWMSGPAVGSPELTGLACMLVALLTGWLGFKLSEKLWERIFKE